MSDIYRGGEARAVWNGKRGTDCNLEYESVGFAGCSFIRFTDNNGPSFGDHIKYRVMESSTNSNNNSANDKQVDGTHYQTEIQPWDFIEANKLTFLEGNVIKYVCRHRAKNGVRDLMKAKHYLEKLIEVEQSKPLGDSDED